MNTQANRLPHLPMPARRVAALMLSAVAIAALAISAQGFDGAVAPAAEMGAAGAPAGEAFAAPSPRCAECGVIESVREIAASDEDAAVKAPGRGPAGSRGGIEAHLPRSYEITIRLRDGSMRVVRDARPANWRRGEPVTVIAGVD